MSSEPKVPARPPVPSRIVELDSLRAVAALAVLLFHFTSTFGDEFGWPSAPVLTMPWGRFGVNLFFVLSGYVITVSTANTPRPAQFMVNRLARLYPIYWCAVLGAAAVAIGFDLPGFDLGAKDIVLNLTLLQRFAGVANVDAVYWSLTLELMFYVFVFVLLATKAWHRPVRDWVLLAWVGAGLVWSLLPASDDVAWFDRPVARILWYGPLFVVGIVIGGGIGDRLATQVPSVVALLVGAACLYRSVPAQEFWVSVGCVAAVLAAVTLRPAPLRFRPLVALGEASYILYLIHKVPGTVALLRLKDHMSATVAVALVTVAAIGASLVIHRWVELPLVRFVRTTLGRAIDRSPERLSPRGGPR